MSDGVEIKERQRQMWTVGDFPTIAELIQSASDRTVERAGVEAEHDVLDVATGTGNAAMVAAARGAKVTGLDLTRKLVEIARERAADGGVEAEFVEGDAEDLPFADESFDRVLSVFGTMFAPDHQRTAGELVRVCRRGGRIAVSSWTPEGLNGQMFIRIGSHMPPPPPGFTPPVLWGSEDHVRDLFDPLGVELSFERDVVTFEEDSVETWMSDAEQKLGPVIMAKSALEPAGKWEAARDDLLSLYEEANESDDGTMRVRAEYLTAIADVPG